MSRLVESLKLNRDLTDAEFKELLETDIYDKELADRALEIRQKYYNKDIYIRGLIEISNYCKNDCYYCGIRHGNSNVVRYRLNKDEILKSCRAGYNLGFRTFVLQGGEDPWFTDERLCEIVSAIKAEYPDCAVTLSLGERSYASYKKLYEAGADRYLLRHETASDDHYNKLHPHNMSLDTRMKCLSSLKEIGYATGSGFMVGSPYQNTSNLIKDIRYLQKLQPDMIGIGPFLKHDETPFKDFDNGSLNLTLRMISILRIIFPDALIPATTALGTLAEGGRERGIFAGANVVMPNLSPEEVRENYQLYNDKLCTGLEGAEAKENLVKSMKAIGFNVVETRGDKPCKKQIDELT